MQVEGNVKPIKCVDGGDEIIVTCKNGLVYHGSAWSSYPGIFTENKSRPSK